MDTGSYVESMTAFQKISLKNWQNGLNLIQSQWDDVMNKMADETGWAATKNFEPIKKWQSLATQQLKRTTTLMDGLFSSYRALYERPAKPAPTKKAKTVSKKEAVNEPQQKEA